MSISDPHFIRRHGAFFRPGAAGYTENIAAAGIYSKEEAQRYLSADGVSIHPISEFGREIEIVIAAADHFHALLSPQCVEGSSAIWVRWSNEGRRIRKWSFKPFEGGAKYAALDIDRDELLRVLAKSDGLDWDEQCPYEAIDADLAECNSGTCIAAHYEDHDPDWARTQYGRRADAILALLSGEAKAP